MFPFPHDHQNNKDLEFHISSTPHQEDFMQQNLIMMRGSSSHEVLPSDLQGCGLSDNNIIQANITNMPTDPRERKIMRRDNERQRRQLMAIHAESLRSLLPLELIKGKRSISDHINEAVNFIKQLKEKIQELNAKREELKTVYNHYSSSAHDFSSEIKGNLGTKQNTSNIIVGPTCWGGVEIVASTSPKNCSEQEGFALSGVLKALLAEGLSVVECASTTVNQRLLIHTIKCEVDDDLACQNLSELQLKLNYLCNSG